MLFKDISQFQKTADILPILNSAIIVDAFYMTLLLIKAIHCKTIMEWYHKFTLTALLQDVFSIFIGIMFARLLYPILNPLIFGSTQFSIISFLIVAILFQMTHDTLFATIVYAIPRGLNKMVDTFQDYAKEMSYSAILVDSSMITLTVLLSTQLAKLSLSSNVLVLFIALYTAIYLLYQF